MDILPLFSVPFASPVGYDRQGPRNSSLTQFRRKNYRSHQNQREPTKRVSAESHKTLQSPRRASPIAKITISSGGGGFCRTDHAPSSVPTCLRAFRRAHSDQPRALSSLPIQRANCRYNRSSVNTQFTKKSPLTSTTSLPTIPDPRANTASPVVKGSSALEVNLLDLFGSTANRKCIILRHLGHIIVSQDGVDHRSESG